MQNNSGRSVPESLPGCSKQNQRTSFNLSDVLSPAIEWGIRFDFPDERFKKNWEWTLFFYNQRDRVRERAAQYRRKSKTKKEVFREKKETEVVLISHEMAPA